jgi:hypothetical protein
MTKFISKENLKLILQIAAIAILVLFIVDYCNEKKNRKVYEQNQMNYLVDGSRQLQLTRAELKTLLENDQALAGKLDTMGIKVRNVTNIVENTYHIKDTTITHNSFYHDQITDRNYFDIDAGCFRILGYVTPDSIVTNSKELNDKLTTFLYKDFRRRFWFIKWSPYYTAKTWSECKHDTISVTRNIKIR